MRKIIAYILFCIIIFSAVPVFAVKTRQAAKIQTESTAFETKKTEASFVKASDFDKYIISVVAAEMPALYNIEALKAQAVASRTYALNSMHRTGDSDYTKIGQAYISESEMKNRWGDNFDEYYGKISEAVISTNSEIIVYEGEPIVAVFHALSGGKTENSADVWSEDLPYLQSVDSSFDETAKDFEVKYEFSGHEFMSLLQDKFIDIKFSAGDIINQISINEYSEGGYVKTITIGNKIMDGADLRQILGLRSTNFIVYRELDKIVFVTRGYGHGAGMSQVGANYLANQGYTYKEILCFYYSGVSIEAMEQEL